jgi:hypothetical protein
MEGNLLIPGIGPVARRPVPSLPKPTAQPAPPRRRFAPISIAAAAFFVAAAPLDAMTLDVAETMIVSLANSPRLIAIDGVVDATARPSLFLDLEFQNQCYATVGADFALIEAADDLGAVLIIGQAVPDDGCPDIFQPTRASLRALLPTGLAGSMITVVTRPSIEGGVRTLRLEPGPVMEADRVQEVNPAADEILPILVRAETRAARTVGYDLVGRLLLSPDCRDGDLSVRVFEIPDADGNPTTDAVMVTAPRHCAGGEADAVDVSIHVGTPQPLRGRGVVTLNTLPPTVLTIAP